MSLVVPFTPGGGYDAYARMVAPYLEEQLGATVVVENRPGAGGLLALNELMTEGPDGTSMVIMNGVGSGGSAIAEADGAQFSLDEPTYLGRLAGEPQLLVTSASGPYQTWEDLLGAQDFRWGSTGPGASDFITPGIFNSVFGLDAEVVAGFPGSSETELALIQGEVDGMSGEASSRRAAIENGDLAPVLVVSEEQPDWLPDVPLAGDLEMTEEQQDIIDAHLALIDLGRPLVAPPGMEEGLTNCLRDAVQAALEDPELIEESESQERPIGYLSGEDVDALVQRIMDAPDAYQELLASLYS